MSTLEGDNPCADCKTRYNIVWFTDNVFWNAVVRPTGEEMDAILCLRCFVERVEAAGFRPTGWRITPEWPWFTRPLHDREEQS